MMVKSCHPALDPFVKGQSHKMVRMICSRGQRKVTDSLTWSRLVNHFCFYSNSAWTYPQMSTRKLSELLNSISRLVREGFEMLTSAILFHIHNIMVLGHMRQYCGRSLELLTYNVESSSSYHFMLNNG